MTVGVVLAGGASRRYGRDKALVELDGETLVVRAVGAVRAAGVDRVVVMAGPSGRPLPPMDAVVLDDPGDGPLAALAVAAAWAGADDDLLVLACDLVEAAPVLPRLLAVPAGPAAVAVDPGGRLQPLCARWPAAGVLAVASTPAAGGRAMALVDHLDPVHVPATAAELVNLNEPP